MNTDTRNMAIDVDSIDVSRLSTVGEIRAFTETWDSLLACDSQGSLFQSPQMYFAWQQAPDEPEEPCFLVATIDGETVGCAPLAIKPWVTRGPRLRAIGFGSPRGDFIISRHRPEVAAAFVKYLRSVARDWEVMVFEDLRVSSGTMQSLLDGLGGRGYRYRSPEPAPSESWMSVSGTWDEYLHAKGRHFRHSLRYQCKRIERLGAVSYLRQDSLAGADVAFDAFVAMEANSWKATAGSRLSPREIGCFRDLIRNSGGHLRYDILFLQVDGDSVAGLLSFLYRHRYYLFVTFFDERVRDLYPGRPLFREALREAFGRKEISEISFVGSYPYALSWCDQVTEYQKVRIYGPGLRARLAGVLDHFSNRSAKKAGEVRESA